MTLDTTVLLLLLMLLALPFSKPLLLMLLITLMLSRFRILLLLLLLVTGITVKGCALVPVLLLLLLLTAMTGELMPTPLSIRETGLVVLGLIVVVSQADRGIVGSPELGDVVTALGDVVAAVTRSWSLMSLRTTLRKLRHNRASLIGWTRQSTADCWPAFRSSTLADCTSHNSTEITHDLFAKEIIKKRFEWPRGRPHFFYWAIVNGALSKRTRGPKVCRWLPAMIKE